MHQRVPTNFSRPKERDNEMLKLGDLVIILVKHTTRSHWPLGQIVDAYPGKDNIVRSVKVRTPNDKHVRPSGHLCLFEASCK